MMSIELDRLAASSWGCCCLGWQGDCWPVPAALLLLPPLLLLLGAAVPFAASVLPLQAALLLLMGLPGDLHYRHHLQLLLLHGLGLAPRQQPLSVSAYLALSLVTNTDRGYPHRCGMRMRLKEACRPVGREDKFVQD
jgi:hypothetical protein